MVDTRQSSHILVLAPGRQPAQMLERALAHLGTERRVPHDIRIVTTALRLGEVQRELLTPSGARRVASACERAGFPRDEILFNQRTVHVLDLDEGECESRADRLLDLLRRLCHSEDGGLTVVLAEDAGVPGHLLQACLQVVGRTADRLWIELPADRTPGRARTEPGECRYLEIPLLLWPATEPLPASYAEAVEVRRRERRRLVRPDVLRLDRRRRTVWVGETSLTLPAMQFFWLYYLALSPGEIFPLREIVVEAGGGDGHPVVTQELSDGRRRAFPADLQRVFVQLFPHAADKFDATYARACGPYPGLPSTISKINAAFRRTLGRGAGPYLIQGGRGVGGYRLTLPAHAIDIVGRT
jgi:hypothetical protein